MIKEEVKDEVIERIVDCAKANNDKAVFGEEVAEILFEYGLINKAVYEILKGE